MAISSRDCAQLRWLSKQYLPAWGGHLGRGEPCSDPDMVRWLEQGLIRVVDQRGYEITAAGLAEVKACDGTWP